MPSHFHDFGASGAFIGSDPVLVNQIGINPVPRYETEYRRMGRGYMRFGWCEENGGPVSDSTYDEIVTWPHPSSMSNFSDLWTKGRYHHNTFRDNSGNETTALGLFTSPRIDILRELQDSLGAQMSAGVRPRSVSWTLWWPRYNWRPGQSGDTDWRNWGDDGGTRLPNGMAGVDVDPSNEADPVTGIHDPVTIDIYDPDLDRWAFSTDTDWDDINLFSNMNAMSATAAGSNVLAQNIQYNAGDQLQYRVYFHLQPEQLLLESPVFDDITFTFSTDKPVILEWNVMN